MKNSIKYLLLTLMLMSGVSNAVLINFDNHIATSQGSGTPPANTVVTNDYISEGVVFGRTGVSAGVAVVNNPNTYSNPNGVCGLNAIGDLTSSCIGDIYFNFVNNQSDAVTDFVSFVVGDSGGDLDRWVINVFGIADKLLESRAVSSLSNVTETFSYSGMNRFQILWASSETTGFLFDDLNFSSPTISVVASEPGTIVLLGLGLVLLGFSRRIRNTG